MSGLRRFIAGAVCPQCHGQDKLFVRDEGEQRICECVRCGHREVLDRHGTGPEKTQDVVRILDRAPDAQ
jgi:uncharacterized metal-binding protein (TIGR02443 family)